MEKIMSHYNYDMLKPQALFSTESKVHISVPLKRGTKSTLRKIDLTIFNFHLQELVMQNTFVSLKGK